MAIQGVGVDIVEIARIEEMLQRWQGRFAARAFVAEEIAYCQSKSRPAISYAGRFAAKEAFAKAVGSGIGATFSWRDFAVTVLPSGQPVPLLSQPLQARFAGSKIHLSISHSEHYAIATVIIENI